MQRMTSALLSILLASVLAGCLTYYATERAAIVIINDTSTPVEYAFLQADRWTEAHSLAAGEVDYVFTYEEKDPHDPLLVQLQQLKLSTPSCTAVLSRDDMEKQFMKNPERRHGWDLHVTPQLLIQVGCK